MKNLFLLILLWIACFFIEITFSWDLRSTNLRPYLSYFVLGYAFFVLPTLSGFFFASLAFVFLSSFSIANYIPVLSIFSLYFFIFWIKKKTFVDHFIIKALLVFLMILSNIYLTKIAYGISFSLSSLSSLNILFYLAYLSTNAFLGILCFWSLEVKGIAWEERLLSFHFKSKRSSLRRKSNRRTKAYRFRFARSPRRRLILKDSW